MTFCFDRETVATELYLLVWMKLETLKKVRTFEKGSNLHNQPNEEAWSRSTFSLGRETGRDRHRKGEQLCDPDGCLERVTMVLLEGGPNRPLHYTDTQPWNTSNCLIEWLFSMGGIISFVFMISSRIYSMESTERGQSELWPDRMFKISQYSKNQQDFISLDKTNLACWFYMKCVCYDKVTPFFLLFNPQRLNSIYDTSLKPFQIQVATCFTLNY